jgi:pyruvate dehydrogenase E1 component
MKALPESIAHWMPDNYTTLGTDGFGISESREDLRNHFEVSAQYIAYTALYGLHKAGDLTPKALNNAMLEWDIDSAKPSPAQDVF